MYLHNGSVAGNSVKDDFNSICPPEVRLIDHGDYQIISGRFGDYADVDQDVITWHKSEIGPIDINQIRKIQIDLNGTLLITFVSNGEKIQDYAYPNIIESELDRLDESRDLSITNLKIIIKKNCFGWKESFYTDEYGRQWIDYSKLNARQPVNEEGLKVPNEPKVNIQIGENLAELRDYLTNILIESVKDRDGNVLYRKRPKISRSDVLEATQEICKDNKINVLKNWLDSLAPPELGIPPKLETMLMDCGCAPLGTEGTDEEREKYIRTVSTCMILSIIELAHGLKPKCVFIIHGEQNARKSALLKAIGMGDIKEGGHYTEYSESLGKKKLDLFVSLQDVLICELSEGEALAGIRPGRIKSILEETELVVRSLYTTNHRFIQGRYWIYVITTNEIEFLSDLTGEARFYPISMRNNGVNIEEYLTPDLIIDCFREGMELYRNGVRTWQLLDKVQKIANLGREIMSIYATDKPWQNLLALVQNRILTDGYIFEEEVSQYIEDNFYGQEKQRIRKQWGSYKGTHFEPSTKRRGLDNMPLRIFRPKQN